ncbi:MAG: hypothetical protein ACRBDI_03375 [Alphaproteobacteria bacterium]
MLDLIFGEKKQQTVDYMSLKSAMDRKALILNSNGSSTSTAAGQYNARFAHTVSDTIYQISNIVSQIAHSINDVDLGDTGDIQADRAVDIIAFCDLAEAKISSVLGTDAKTASEYNESLLSKDYSEKSRDKRVEIEERMHDGVSLGQFAGFERLRSKIEMGLKDRLDADVYQNVVRRLHKGEGYSQSQGVQPPAQTLNL